MLQDSTIVQEKWTLEYGTTFKFRGLLGVRRPITYAGIERQAYLELRYLQSTRLYTTDLKAINHFLVNDYDYPKPEAAIYNIQRIVGKGEFVVFHNHRHDMCEPESDHVRCASRRGGCA